MNKDYSDMLKALENCEVEFLLVGAYAVASYGYTRATGDLDLWVNPTQQNAAKVWKALEQFGAPRSRVTVEDFSSADWVFQIGAEPMRIDILTGVDALEFDSAMKRSTKVKLGDFTIPAICLEDLIKNKIQTGRPKDKLDVSELNRIHGRQAGEA